MKTKLRNPLRFAALIFSLSLSTVFAQIGLPLNFSPLSNPLPTPQSYYLDSDPNIPLGDKTPLVLVHGIDLFSGTPASSADGWTNFCIWFYNTPSIRNRFKIYRFAYQSNQTSVQTLGNYLAQLLNANDGFGTDQQLAGKDIVILAHSMGGLVTRRFMEEQRQTKAAKWNQSALRLITLATPHHGTPAANRCDYVLNPLPDYIGALGYKFKQELGTIDFAIAAAGISLANGIFHVIPSYNQPNRLDLLWDNYDGLFASGFSPDEINPPTATLNSISSAQSYDYKIVTYAGYFADGTGHSYLSATADILANGLGIPNDGIVPIDSAWFQGRVGNSQLRFFDDYDHFQMMKSKTLPGDLPSPSDPLFTMIGNDLTSALPPATPPTITSVSPATLPPSGSPQLVTINGTNFKLPGDPNASSLIFYDPANTAYPRTPINVTTTSMQYNLTVQSATGTWKVKVVNGPVESLPFSFTVASSGVQLTGLSISGPAAIAENNSGQFTATAFFSDGTSSTVTSSTSWSENSSVTTISSSGLLSAGSVSGDTAVTVSASYSLNGITKSTSANVTVVNAGSGGGTTTIHPLVNGTFESGSSPWAPSGYADIVALSYPHLGSWYAYLCNANSADGAFGQLFAVPAGTTAATIQFYLNVVSSETSTTTEFDTMNVDLGTANEQYVGRIAHFSNLDKGGNVNGSYVLKSYTITSLVTPYAGQSLFLTFGGHTDTTLSTIFRIDDVDITLTVNNPVSLTGLSIRGPSSIPEGRGDAFWADAILSDGTTQTISPNSWSENSSVTTISSDGFLVAGSVSSDTPVTVTASYTFNGVTQQATKSVTIVDTNATHTLSSLAISGPSSMNENSSGQFTATAIFTDGTSQSVTPSWSENSTATIISSGGLLTAGEVSSDTTVTVSASYTTGGVTRNASQDVLIINTPTTPTLTSLAISGASSLNENSTSQYSATASFSDGSSQTVIPTWSEDSAATTISSFGLLSAGEVTNDTSVTVSASYTIGGITRNVSQGVLIMNTGPTLTYLSIDGPSVVSENSTAQYSATASFSDGSSQIVNPTWSEDSTATSISTFGLLSAGVVASNIPVMISASYTLGGVTRNVQKIMMVVHGGIGARPGSSVGYDQLHASLGGTNDFEFLFDGVIEGSDGRLYGGGVNGGGSDDGGMIFAMNKDGSAFRLLHAFMISTNDGLSPWGGVVEASDGKLYGATRAGGKKGNGTIFRLNTDGSNFTLIYSFDTNLNNGAFPLNSVIEASDGKLYGRTCSGGTSNANAIFRLNKDGSNYELLHSFSVNLLYGGDAFSGLTEGNDGKLYGTTFYEGAIGRGSVFRMNKDGSSFETLHSFLDNATDGGFPFGPVYESSDGIFYGSTSEGGPADEGTVFRISRNGSGYQVLQTFNSMNGLGYLPVAPPIEGPGGLLYGTTYFSGAKQTGMIYQMRKDGGDFRFLYEFQDNNMDGNEPNGPLLHATDGALYGTTFSGSGPVYGSVFRIKPVVLRGQEDLNRFILHTDGFVSHRYAIEASELTPPSWVQVTATTNMTGTVDWFDSTTNKDHRFYRVRVLNP